MAAGSGRSEEVRVSITYGDGISVSRDEYGLPAVKVQSRVFEEPARWITCDVSAGPDRDRFLAELAQAIVHMGQLPIGPELDEV